VERPKLRPDLELLVAEGNGERLLIVRDPHSLAADAPRFGIGALPILQYFDGTNSVDDVRADLARQGAGFVGRELLQGVVDVLDRHYLLENETFRAELRYRDGFVEAPVRRPAHAGQAYPAEREAARAFFQEMLDLAAESPAAPVRRLVAPHIDLRLGGDVYAHAHQRLRASGRPDVVVVLGVRHAPGTRRFVACRKDFETPLGTVPCDHAFLDALEGALGEDLGEGVGAHRREHSVEFQALWLAHLWPEDPPAIVPLLVGSFHDLVETGASPASDTGIEAFVRALRATLETDERRVVVVASVDFAHVGPMYDHAEGLDEAGERNLEEIDREVLEHVRAGRAEEFFRSVAADGNARNICGLAPVYVTLRLAKTQGDLLRYGQGRIHPESGSVVSFAALAFAE